MADELNIPTHRWYQKRNHIALAKEDVSRQYIYDSGIQKIDAWINSQPWGDVYIVNRLSPNLVFDFDESYFRTEGTATDLVSAATHTRAGNATMVDSDGVLKWAPHNFLSNSTDFTVFFLNNVTRDAEVADPDGTSLAYTITATADLGFARTVAGSAVPNVVQTDAFYIRRRTGSGPVYLYNVENLNYTEVTVTTEWTLVKNLSGLKGGNRYTGVVLGTSGDAIDIYGKTIFRSDLGGMVDNPATGDSYVPTTDAAKYLPRVGHHVWDGSAWVNRGMLVEPTAATNWITGSNDFLPANNHWQEYISSNRVTVTAGQEVGPDGALSMSLLTDGVVTTAAHGLTTFYDQSLTIANGATFTASCYVKDKDRRYVTVVGSGNTSNNWFAVTVDLLDGSITKTGFGATSNLTSSSVEATGDGIYRISVSGNVMDSETKTGVWIFLADTPTPVYGTYGQSNHDGANLGVYTYGAQLETGSVPTSYIPTVGATATRAADIVTVPAANLPYNATNMSIQLDGLMTYADTDLATQLSFFYWSLNSTNFIKATLNTQGTRLGEVQFYQRESVSGQDLLTGPNGGYSAGINVPFNIASRHGFNFINGAVDGTALTANLTPTSLPDLSTSDLQLANTGGPMIISKFRMWADDLTDAGIAEASS